MNKQITEYINSSPEKQKEILSSIRSLIHQHVKNVTEEFKWSRPVFKLKKDFAYLKTNKNYCSLGFMKAHKINDVNNLLEGTGKDMRHIKVYSITDFNEELIKEWILAVTKDEEN
ncbi:MAG: DUF1801 domain-containing protein [Bacteroidetes bacterium]|nr:DUF1801 domain-containing protein [Bacteroidota bacterium]